MATDPRWGGEASGSILPKSFDLGFGKINTQYILFGVVGLVIVILIILVIKRVKAKNALSSGHEDGGGDKEKGEEDKKKNKSWLDFFSAGHDEQGEEDEKKKKEGEEEHEKGHGHHHAMSKEEVFHEIVERLEHLLEEVGEAVDLLKHGDISGTGHKIDSCLDLLHHSRELAENERDTLGNIFFRVIEDFINKLKRNFESVQSYLKSNPKTAENMLAAMKREIESAIDVVKKYAPKNERKAAKKLESITDRMDIGASAAYA